MYRQALVFPVPEGRSDHDVKQIAAYFGSHPREYRASRARLGISLERVYLQKTPAGNAVVAYLEGSRSFGEVVGLMLSSTDELDRHFIEDVKNIHGVDLRALAGAPMPETIGEWVDSSVSARGRGLGFVTPVLPGQSDKGTKHILEAFGARQNEFTQSRRGFGESVEVVTLNPTPMGDFVAVYLEGKDPLEANRLFAASRAPFDAWFKDGLKGVIPIGLDDPLPPIEEFFDSLALAVPA